MTYDPQELQRRHNETQWPGGHDPEIREFTTQPRQLEKAVREKLSPRPTGKRVEPGEPTHGGI
ncbi:MAG: hypothetical protein HYV13_03905 [Candidatus Doudnabacteria bacterium]|nr:hypothetical protein [Candidatus Doudnabacteria bacterium]